MFNGAWVNCPDPIDFRYYQLVDIYGDEVEQIIAPQDGVYVRATTLSTVSRGERAATLGQSEGREWAQSVDYFSQSSSFSP